MNPISRLQVMSLTRDRIAAAKWCASVAGPCPPEPDLCMMILESTRLKLIEARLVIIKR
jgi:hypothetical protein